MKTNHFERELPKGYSEVMTIDFAKNKRLMIWLNIVAVTVMVGIVAAAFLLLWNKLSAAGSLGFSEMLVLFITILVYCALHELMHGIVYKAMTGEKLCFGLDLKAGVAYCGIPDIYVYRNTALAALLAPFVVFTLLFGILIAVLGHPMYQLYVAVLLGVHVGGCAGDLYDTCLLLTKLREPSTLMKDTGPKQIFYQRGKNE